MSAVPNASTSASTDSSLKRTLPSAIQDPPRATKRPKTETKLDKLKAQQKAEAARLVERIELELKLVKDKDVADEVVLEQYVYFCNKILADEELDETVLAVFKLPYADSFGPEAVLLEKLGQSMLSGRIWSAWLMSTLQERR